MERWKNLSRNPLKRMKIAYTMRFSIVRCVNCGRALSGDFKIHANSSGYLYCRCGYTNYFLLIGKFLWELKVDKNETNGRQIFIKYYNIVFVKSFQIIQSSKSSPTHGKSGLSPTYKIPVKLLHIWNFNSFLALTNHDKILVILSTSY